MDAGVAIAIAIIGGLFAFATAVLGVWSAARLKRIEREQEQDRRKELAEREREQAEREAMNGRYERMFDRLSAERDRAEAQAEQYRQQLMERKGPG